MSVAEQIVLYQELAAHDAPRLVLAFVGIRTGQHWLGADVDRERVGQPEGEAAVAQSWFRIGICRTAAPSGNGHIGPEASGTSCPGTGAGATPWPVRATPNASAAR